MEQREYFRAGCGVWTGKATVELRIKEETRVLKIEYRQEYDALYKVKKDVPKATGTEVASGTVLLLRKPRGHLCRDRQLSELRIEDLPPVSVTGPKKVAG